MVDLSPTDCHTGYGEAEEKEWMDSVIKRNEITDDRD
jgi:hypothetical protein